MLSKTGWVSLQLSQGAFTPAFCQLTFCTPGPALTCTKCTKCHCVRFRSSFQATPHVRDPDSVIQHNTGPACPWKVHKAATPSTPRRGRCWWTCGQAPPSSDFLALTADQVGKGRVEPLLPLVHAYPPLPHFLKEGGTEQTQGWGTGQTTV